jgi:hypothetical protein
MNQNETPEYEAMRARFEEIFSKIFAKKPTKPRDLNLRATPSQKPASATPDSKCR